MNGQRAVKPVIGIVGGIGAGKSAAAAELVDLGCRRVDADQIGHELLNAPDVIRQVRQRFGGGVLGPDGAVDRHALGRIVFADAAELRALNAIMHPRIRLRIRQQIAQARADSEVAAVVIDAAVLFEAGWNDLCSHVLFVETPSDQRADRVRTCRGWDELTWRRREKMQISLDY